MTLPARSVAWLCRGSFWLLRGGRPSPRCPRDSGRLPADAVQGCAFTRLASRGAAGPAEGRAGACIGLGLRPVLGRRSVPQPVLRLGSRASLCLRSGPVLSGPGTGDALARGRGLSGKPCSAAGCTSPCLWIACVLFVES